MLKIQVLGTGCPKCKQLAENAQNAASKSGIEFELEKVTSINDIMAFGVMMTPALAIDGKVVISGKVASEDEIADMLKNQ